MIRLKMIKNILFNFQQTYYFLNVSTSIDVFFKSTIRVQCLLKSSSTMISPETKNTKSPTVIMKIHTHFSWKWHLHVFFTIVIFF